MPDVEELPSETDIVDRWKDADPDVPPLVVVESLGLYLDEHGLGEGPIEVRRIGDGHSFETFLVRRASQSMVLRRPPRPPLDPGVHDITREALVLTGLATTPVRAPRLLAICDDDTVIGVPFTVMECVPGIVVARDEDLPPELEGAEDCRRLGTELIDALVELHACDYRAAGLGDLGRASGFLERRLSRSQQAWDRVAVRSVPAITEAGELLRANLPPAQAPSLVHGDFRLGNVMYARRSPAQLIAILDWETTTIGDPLTDIGYTLATSPEAGDSEGVLLSLQSVALRPGFPDRRALAERYAQRSGRSLELLSWYMAYSLWRVAIQLEGLYARFVDGRSTDVWHREFEAGVPELAERALSLAHTF